MQQTIFTTVFHGIDEAEYLIARWSTPEDREQSGQRRILAAQQNFLLSRAALRALLQRITDRSDWKFWPDSRGKLQAFTAAEIAGPHISLSHTSGLVACAISHNHLVGIDVERWRARDFMAIANYAFGPREREVVVNEGASGFYRIWTLREAIAKATGEGLLAMIDGRDCSFDEKQSQEKWQLFYNLPEPSYSLAIAQKCGDQKTEPPIRIDIMKAT